MDARQQKSRVGIRRGPRFSLRALFAVVSLFAVWLSVGVNRAHREEEALPHITDCGAPVSTRDRILPIPNRIPGVVYGAAPSDASLRKVAPHLVSLPSLSYLQIVQTAVTDDGLRQLDNVQNIKKLDLWDNEITDEGFSDIRRHANLVELDLKHYTGLR